MAKVTYISITPGLENQYFSGIRIIDRFNYARVGLKNTLLSAKSKKGLSQKSLLPTVNLLWQAMTSADRSAWESAGAVCNKTGFRLFTQDYCARRFNGLEGVAIPSLLHQSLIGNIHIEAPAVECKISQIHPKFYYVYKKVTGKKGMYEPVLVTESLTLPFTLSLNYAANLVSQGVGSFAKCYVRFWYSYQGVDKYHDLEISLDLITDWKYATAVLNSLQTIVIRYDVYFYLYNLRGDLYFDNIGLWHGGINYARDQFCNDINQGFTKAFYQIPKNWSAEILPTGAIIDSIYKDF